MPSQSASSKPKAEAKEHLNQGHPLFPLDPEKGHTQGEIAWIYVSRDGQMCPEKFAADTLCEFGDIAERFGGGTYLLRARDKANARWTASHQFTLAGPKKPLFAAPSAAESAPTPPPGPDSSMAFAVQMMNSQTQQTLAMMQGMFGVMAGMFQSLKPPSPPPESPALVEVVKGLMAKAQQESPSSPEKMFETLMDVWQSSAEYHRGILEGKANSPEPSGEGMIKALLGGMKEAKEVFARPAPRPAGPVGPAPAAGAPPGDPVAALAAMGRTVFGDAAADLSPEEIAQRYLAKAIRDKRGNADAEDAA